MSINGQPLVGDLGQFLENIYQSIAEGTAPDVISVELENHLSIPLVTAQFRRDQHALSQRYPTLPLWARYGSQTNDAQSKNASNTEARIQIPGQRKECIPEPDIKHPGNIDLGA
jgi:hypothetical protein